MPDQTEPFDPDMLWAIEQEDEVTNLVNDFERSVDERLKDGFAMLNGEDE